MDFFFVFILVMFRSFMIPFRLFSQYSFNLNIMNFVIDKRFFSFLYSGFDYEVIVIDDGSPDGTLEIAKKLQELYGDDKIVSTAP